MIASIPFLTAPGNISFDVVIHSLPGYGFSEKPDKEGINAGQIATLWIHLMEKLGYRKFFVQGGDLRADVSTNIALRYPGHVLGLHLNEIPFSYTPYLGPGEQLTDAEMAAQQKMAAFFQAAGAYTQQHTSGPPDPFIPAERLTCRPCCLDPADDQKFFRSFQIHRRTF